MKGKRITIPPFKKTDHLVKQEPSTASTSQAVQPMQKQMPKKRRRTKAKKSKAQQKPSTQQQHSTQRRWLPKPLLQAQGYYQGNSCIWAPKQKTLQTKITANTEATKPQQQPKSKVQFKVEPKTYKQKWVPKTRAQPPLQPAPATLNQAGVTSKTMSSTTASRATWQIKKPTKLEKGKVKLAEYCMDIPKGQGPQDLCQSNNQPTETQKLVVIKKAASLPISTTTNTKEPDSVGKNINLNAWNTLTAWSANSYVTDKLLHWQKSLESGISSTTMLGITTHIFR